jgi:hypothetical protein
MRTDKKPATLPYVLLKTPGESFAQLVTSDRNAQKHPDSGTMP